MFQHKSKILQKWAFSLLVLLTVTAACTEKDTFNYGEWPEITSQQKTWARWWWMGSAVDKESITAELEAFSAAGIGGVEITPIYGVKGYEEQFIDFLSPKWIEMLVHTVNEAERLNMKVDMVMGTGWPFGGPMVEPEYAASKITIQKYPVLADKIFEKEIIINDPKQKGLAELQHVIVFESNGEMTDLTPLLKDNVLKYASSQNTNIYAVFCAKTRQQVKRSAPGGAGYTLDHLSNEAFNDYSEPFTEALTSVKGNLRGIFNDSYEVYSADFSPNFLDEFKNRRHYDLLQFIPVLDEKPDNETYRRLLTDYRETMGDMLLENFTQKWTEWSNNNTFITRYQAHGSPGNLIDLYAAADIPECEVFGSPRYDIPGYRRDTNNVRPGDSNKMMLKFASSAAHLQGKEIVSSESFTWLREHFKTALSHAKPVADDLFLSGVNHIFLHGSTFSPKDEEWPGWKFYASVNFNPTNTIWKDTPYLFDYIARCQSILQKAKTDNEVLLYFPIHDAYATPQPERLLHMLNIHSIDKWLTPTSFYQIATELDENGIGFDFISDSFLMNSTIENGSLKTAEGASYKTLIVPDTESMPEETLEQLMKLKQNGASIFFMGLPETVPGLFNVEQRENAIEKMLKSDENLVEENASLISWLKKNSVYGENASSHGLKIIRKKLNGDKIYFIANHSSKTIDKYVHFNAKAESALLMDPLTQKTGVAKIKTDENGIEVMLQLKPGETIFMHAISKEVDMEAWQYYSEGTPIIVNSKWNIEFLDGGPSLPATVETDELGSWTELGAQYDDFSGTARYTTTFDLPANESGRWRLNLGDVRESARVFVNGEYAGTCFAHPYSIEISEFVNEGENLLEIEVTNLAANRLRALERSGKEWKKFYEINMVNIHYQKFDATVWQTALSGLCSPVSLVPLH
ncbi:MAG: glycosyl hydrolase [Prolixibacteraceae bacterium]|jgi:hypothetical protein|nr:glycosyl hydrolase [Prolixibacteraceae bacterium]